MHGSFARAPSQAPVALPPDDNWWLLGVVVASAAQGRFWKLPINSDHGAKWAGVPRLGRTPSFGMTVPVGIWDYIPSKREGARTQLPARSAGSFKYMGPSLALPRKLGSRSL